MSNKTQRTAWNLTRLYATHAPSDFSYALYEIGQDAGLALIDTTHIGADVPQQYVAIPQKVWDAARAEQARAERHGVNAGYLTRCAEKWYRDAMNHGR